MTTARPGDEPARSVLFESQAETRKSNGPTTNRLSGSGWARAVRMVAASGVTDVVTLRGQADEN
jgi:hypothetical protein